MSQTLLGISWPCPVGLLLGPLPRTCLVARDSTNRPKE